MSTLAVVEEILRETRVPMSVRQIVEHAGSRLPSKSKTPDTVVARDLSMDIKRKGEASLFIRTSPGRYTLREIHMETLASQGLNEEGIAPPINAAEVQPAEQSPTQAVASTLGGDAEPAPGEAAATEVLAPDGQPAAEHTPLLATALRAERAGVMPARKPSSQDGHQSAGTP